MQCNLPLRFLIDFLAEPLFRTYVPFCSSILIRFVCLTYSVFFLFSFPTPLENSSVFFPIFLFPVTGCICSKIFNTIYQSILRKVRSMYLVNNSATRMSFTVSLSLNSVLLKRLILTFHGGYIFFVMYCFIYSLGGDRDNGVSG